MKKFPPKRKPREKQAEALKRLVGQKAFALLMAMRTGKSKVVLDDWARLYEKGEIDTLIIIAPGGAYRTWEKAIQEDVCDGLIALTKVFTWLSGSKKIRKQTDDLLVHLGPRILLMNVEALSSVKDAQELCKELLKTGRAMLVIDESVIIKNPAAKRSKFIIRELAPLAAYRRILSGLPTPRSPLDLYSQFEFLDPRILGYKSYYSFRATFAVMRQMLFGGRRVSVVVGYQNTEKLSALIEPYSFRVRLEDCYDMPASDYSMREVPLTEDQRRIYQELKEFATASLGNEQHVTATMVITQILRLHQVLCGHTVDELGNTIEIPEKRTATLLDLLDDFDGKAIIWCSYDADIRKVSEAIQKRMRSMEEEQWVPGTPMPNVARFWGGNRSTREEEEHRFKTDPQTRFMVATQAAGGRGRTWDCADLVVYYSNTNDLDHRSQSEERPKAVGKTKSIGYVDLVAPKTVDEKIIKALREKMNMAAIITGDDWREWLV